jgi:DNA-binding IclR family transcriptional regulator
MKNTDNFDDRDRIESVVVAHKVLQALSTSDAPLTLSELARRLKLTIPRVYRHLMTLTALGMVEKTGEEPSYQLGWQIVRLGERAVRQHDLTPIAYPHLKTLRAALRQTTMLTRRCGNEVIVWLSLDSGQVPDIVVPPGTRLPLHATAAGRTHLAFASAEEQRRILDSPLAADVGPGPITDAAELATRLKHIRETFYDLQAGAGRMEINAIAAPVFNHRDEVTAAVTIVGLAAAISNPPRKEVVESVLFCAAAISRELGNNLYDSKIGEHGRLARARSTRG